MNVRGIVLRGNLGGDEEAPRPPKKDPLWEALRPELDGIAARYIHGRATLEGHPFKRGDIVCFRRGYGPENMTERPAVVVELFQPQLLALDIQGPDGSRAWMGRRADTRIILFDSDHDFIPYWVESWVLRAYEPPLD